MNGVPDDVWPEWLKTPFKRVAGRRDARRTTALNEAAVPMNHGALKGLGEKMLKSCTMRQIKLGQSDYRPRLFERLVGETSRSQQPSRKPARKAMG